MGAAEDALTSWAATATDQQLDLGPSLSDLGGADVIIAEAQVLATGPHLPLLLQSLVNPDVPATQDTLAALTPAIDQGFRQPYRAWVLLEACEILNNEPVLSNAYGRKAATALLRHAEAALDGGEDPAYAHPAIAGLLPLCLGGYLNHRRLTGLLTDIRGDEPPDALHRLPLLIGIAYDHYRDDGLLGVLHTLEHAPALPPAARNDARYELALATLSAALHADQADEVMRLLKVAALRLANVEDAEEARLDARAYRLAVTAALAFADLDGQRTSTVRDRLVSTAHDLDATVAQRFAWAARRHQPPWLEARGHTEAAWHQLVATLRHVSTRLLEPSWLDATKVLAEVLQVYQAGRAVYTTSAGDGLEQILAPAVEGAFIQEMALLYHLEQALQHDAELSRHPDAQQLVKRVQARRGALQSGAPAEPPGKPVAGQPFSTWLPDNLDPAVHHRILGVLDDHARGFALTGNVLLDSQLESLHAALAESPAWKEPARSYFTSLQTHFLRFLHDRFDAQADKLGAMTAYLGPPKPGQKLWLEEDVQNDCLQYLTGMLEPGSVQREVIDVASGRTDITYTPQPGMRFIIEVKRHESKWTRDGLEAKYSAQAANYTATTPPFCILFIGDHSNHSKGYTSLQDSVWHTWLARSPTETPRFILIGVLPIGGFTPSELTRRARLSRARRTAQPRAAQ
ncbi:hypothetical protein ACPXB1_26725 [Micromonospora sp. DT68]|uniref:hypothetical protein n=1 Tax=Micromonospora sp. DT68 TaxID=3416522 RepID=UPI003CF48FB0